MKKERTIEELLGEIGVALKAMDKAERTRVGAELERSKAKYEYFILMDALNAKEYTI